MIFHCFYRRISNKEAPCPNGWGSFTDSSGQWLQTHDHHPCYRQTRLYWGGSILWPLWKENENNSWCHEGKLSFCNCSENKFTMSHIYISQYKFYIEVKTEKFQIFFFSILKETISRSLEGRISHLIPGWKLDSSLKDKQEHQWVVNFKHKECMENF